MSKPIQLRKTSREDWQTYLGECYEAGADDPEALLRVFLTSPDLIRAAHAEQRNREAKERCEVRKVVNWSLNGGDMAKQKPKAAGIDIDLSFLNGAAIAAICNLIIKWIDTTPEAQHERNHARADRILTFIEERIFKLPPLP